MVEEQGTGFCHGGGRGRGWVVRVDGYGSFWWVLRWFSWWDLWWLWYGWWVFGGWLGLCGGMSDGFLVVVVWWLWYEWWVFGGCSIDGGFLVSDWGL